MTTTRSSRDLVILSAPPMRKRHRQSKWNQIFGEARKHPNEWMQVMAPMTKSTAMQQASDIRNAHTREDKPKGIEEGEIWDATWDTLDDGQIYLWIKLVRN